MKEIVMKNIGVLLITSRIICNSNQKFKWSIYENIKTQIRGGGMEHLETHTHTQKKKRQYRVRDY